MYFQPLFVFLTILSLLGGSILGAPPQDTALAQAQAPAALFAPLTKTVTLMDLGYTKDETVQGALVSRSFTVNWPESWQAQPGSKIVIEFSHSAALKSYSSMAVDWNGARLGSTLFNATNTDRGQVSVEIPANAIQPGYNELALVFFMGINDDICEDPNNPATWATIHNTSTLTFLYEPLPPEVDLGIYPLPILETGSLAQNSVTFVIPAKPGLAELNALAIVSAKLGEMTVWPLAIDVVTEADPTSQRLTGDVIFIGRAANLKAAAPFFDGATLKDLDSRPLPINAGILIEQISPVDPLSVHLLVTGVSDEALMLAARALGNETVFPRLQGAVGVVSSVPEVKPSPDAGQVRTIRFEDLGYEDQTARGTKQQTLNYVFPLPKEWRVLSEATIHLNFSHSELAHPERSSITLSVNGVPVGSVLLTADNARNGQADFAVPARMFTLGRNRISVASNIELMDGYQKTTGCPEDYFAEAWVVVYADSLISLPTGASYQRLDLAEYPYGFIGSTNLSDLAFVVSETPSAADAWVVGRMAYRIGLNADGLGINPMVLSASKAKDFDASAPYQILIGMPTENKAIAEMNDRLPLPFQGGSNEPQPNPQVAQLVGAPASLGIVQAAFAADGNPRLVVSGTNAEGLTWAGNALSDSILIRDLRGDLVLADSSARITGITVTKPAQTVAEQPAIEPQPAPVQRTTTWILWVAGAIILLSLLILAVFISIEIANRRQAR